MRPRFRLPDGWRWVKLAEVGSLTDGDWILNSDYAASGVRLLQLADIGCGVLTPKSDRHVAQPRAEELRCTFLAPGDILISRMPDPIGRACALPELGYPTITAVDVSILRPSPQTADIAYLVHYMNSREWLKAVTALASGATRPRISRRNLEAIRIPLPPLVEQKRIAAILTEQLAAVDQARAAAHAQLEAAHALPPALLRDLFDSPEARQWPRQPVKNLCRSIDYGYTASADFAARPPYLLRITDIQSGSVNWQSVPGCRISTAQEAKYALADGDVVFARTGATTGKSYLIRRPPRAVFASYLIRLRPSDLVVPDYLYAFFQSDKYWSQVRQHSRGGAQPNVNATLLGRIVLPVPSTARQGTAMQSLNARVRSISRTEARLQEQLATICALPAAFLGAAFNGEL
jgi:type I restriction enzyme S subunit